MAVERIYKSEIIHLNSIIVGLCEISKRCPICYRYMNGGDCGKCKTYYGDCDCKPLTREQIENGETTNQEECD